MANTQYQKEIVRVNGQDIEVFKIDHDVNGNPRYVIHYLSILPKDHQWAIGTSYAKAVQIIHDIGGRKYTAKWFGGGLVFTSYSVQDDLASIIPAA